MDPDLAIRPWLVACGSNLGELGVREAHHYRWKDAIAGGRVDVPYFVYRILSANEGNSAPGVTNANKAVSGSDYDAVFRAQQEWLDTVAVDLYNHKFGMEVLKACAIAARKDPDVSSSLASNNAKLKRVVSVEDLTPLDTTELEYHHRMVCQFTNQAIYQHTKTNERIETVDYTGAFDLE